MNTAPNHQSSTQSERICAMFDHIAPRYDLLNHLLSFGFDIRWRREVARSTPKNRPLDLLDLATGTGDLLVACLNSDATIARAVGLDLSQQMIDVARRKLNNCAGRPAVELIRGDACNTGMPDSSFDVITMGFGIRNTPDVALTLREIFRLLKPGGSTLILEFSMPDRPFFKKLYAFYLRHLVPALGALIARDRTAYRYLNTSIEAFEAPAGFEKLMRGAGFCSIRTKSLTCGVARIYIGSRPAAEAPPSCHAPTSRKP